MRRLLMLTVAPLCLGGLLAVGCKSDNTNTSTSWNDQNAWGTHHASQSGAMQPGTANTLPPSTQPSHGA
jgi:hypothetical protein